MSQELTSAIVGAAVCFGIPCLWLWAAIVMWCGWETSWLEDRRRGWSYPFGMFAAAAPFIGLGVFSLGMYFGGVVEWIAFLITALCIVVVCPLCIVFAVWWAPRWVLPGWIRERLDVGDPCRSALPAEHLRPLMRCRQNRVDESWRPLAEQLVLPTVLRVNMVRWGVSAVLVLGFGLLGVSAVVGIAPVDDAPAAQMLLWLVPAFSVVLVAVGLFFLVGFLRPLHVELTEEGVGTRDWSVRWEEIEFIGVSRIHVGLRVSPEAFARVRVRNRWHSGRPWGLGGRLAVDGVVRLQSGLKHPVRSAVLLQHLLWVKTGRKSNPDQPEDVLHGDYRTPTHPWTHDPDGHLTSRRAWPPGHTDQHRSVTYDP